jgi:hypothetical protein
MRSVSSDDLAGDVFAAPTADAPPNHRLVEAALDRASRERLRRLRLGGRLQPPFRLRPSRLGLDALFPESAGDRAAVGVQAAPNLPVRDPLAVQAHALGLELHRVRPLDARLRHYRTPATDTPVIETHGQRPLHVIHPLANQDALLQNREAPLLIADVFNLNRRPVEIYLVV